MDDTEVTLSPHGERGHRRTAAIDDSLPVRQRLAVKDHRERQRAGVSIDPGRRLTIGEGDSDTYTVVLNTEPSADVTVTISGHSGTDVGLSDTELTFTTGNWDTFRRR